MVLLFDQPSQNRWIVRNGRKTVAHITKGKDGYFKPKLHTRDVIAIDSVLCFARDLNKQLQPKRARRVKEQKAVEWLEQLFVLEDSRKS